MCNSITENIKIAQVEGPKATIKSGICSVKANDSKIFWTANRKKPMNMHKKILILLEFFVSVLSKNIAAISNIAMKNNGRDNSVRKKSLCLVAVYPDVSKRKIKSFIEYILITLGSAKLSVICSLVRLVGISS